MSQPATPRRSNRLTHNPIVIRNTKPRAASEKYTWVSDVTHSRPSVRDDFLDEEEWAEANGDDDDDDDAEGGETEKEERILMTDFYSSFSISGKKVAGKFARFAKGAAGKKWSKGKQEGEQEVYKTGDTVLVSSANRIPSVGVITGMWENRWMTDSEEGEATETEKKRVKIHWFLRPSELAGVRAKRAHAVNEIYYSLNQIEIVAPSEIIAHCLVSNSIVGENGPSQLWISPEQLEDEDGTEKYSCRSAINSQRGLYYEFDWENHRRAALNGHGAGDGDVWDVLVQEEKTKKGNVTGKKGMIGGGRQKKKIKRTESDEDEIEESEGGGTEDEYTHSPDEDEEQEDDLPPISEGSDSDDAPVDSDTLAEPRTPSKKRKRATTRTPSKPKANALSTPRKPKPRQPVAPTPHSRKSLAARKQKKTLHIRPPPPLTSHLRLENLPTDPWLRAMHVLHVGARPDVLPCREEEYARCLRAVEELIDEGSGGCVYISGVPGTGKTATVHAIVRELKRMAEESETNPFTYVEINGLKIPDPTAAYSLLWEGVSGHDVSAEGHLKISAKESLKCLSRHFSAGGAGVAGGTGARSGAARGRGGPGGHACVVLMDELDQLVTAKQDVVYNFFNWPTLVGSKLIVLAVANTMDLPERVMSGRVRSRLGMIRINFQPYTTPQLERIVQTRLQNAKEGLEGADREKNVIALDGIKFAAMKVSSISGDARRVLDICRRTVEQVQPLKRTANTNDVKEVIKVMQNSPTAAYLRECSLHERIMLAALIRVIKQQGVEEVRWGDVQYQHLLYMNVLPSDKDPTRRPTVTDLEMILESLAASRAMLIEDGVAASRKAEGDRKVILNLEQGEVERVLSDFGGIKWKNALNA